MKDINNRKFQRWKMSYSGACFFIGLKKDSKEKKKERQISGIKKKYLYAPSAYLSAGRTRNGHKGQTSKFVRIECKNLCKGGLRIEQTASSEVLSPNTKLFF